VLNPKYLPLSSGEAMSVLLRKIRRTDAAAAAVLERKGLLFKSD